MFEIVTFALGLSVGGGGFNEAHDRAARYEKEPTARSYIDRTFMPSFQPQINPILRRCIDRFRENDFVNLTLVISYKDGAPNEIFLEKDTLLGRCVAEGFTRSRFPPSPSFPNLAATIKFGIAGKSGK